MPFKFTSLKPEVRVYAFDSMGVSLHSQLRWRILAKRCIEIEEDGLSWGAFVLDEKRLRNSETEILLSERKTIVKYMSPNIGAKEMEMAWPCTTLNSWWSRLDRNIGSSLYIYMR